MGYKPIAMDVSVNNFHQVARDCALNRQRDILLLRDRILNYIGYYTIYVLKEGHEIPEIQAGFKLIDIVSASLLHDGLKDTIEGGYPQHPSQIRAIAKSNPEATRTFYAIFSSRV